MARKARLVQMVSSDGSKGSNSSVSGLFGPSRGLLKVHTFERLSKQSRLVQNGQMVQIGQIQT